MWGLSLHNFMQHYPVYFGFILFPDLCGDPGGLGKL